MVQTCGITDIQYAPNVKILGNMLNHNIHPQVMVKVSGCGNHGMYFGFTDGDLNILTTSLASDLFEKHADAVHMFATLQIIEKDMTDRNAYKVGSNELAVCNTVCAIAYWAGV